jgi:hypothetical protein
MASVLAIRAYGIRHAFIYFEWDNKSVLMGQYWHPLLLPECYADTISFNGGTPIEPFTREPQVRLTKQFDTMTLILAAGSHANTPYDGPQGIDTLYARNAILPNINIQLFSSIRQHICGIGVDITRIVPRLVTNKNIRITESLMSFITMAFAAINWEYVALRTKLFMHKTDALMDSSVATLLTQSTLIRINVTTPTPNVLTAGLIWRIKVKLNRDFLWA